MKNNSIKSKNAYLYESLAQVNEYYKENVTNRNKFSYVIVTGLRADWLLCNRTLQLSSMSVTNSLKLLVKSRLLVELLEFKRFLQFFVHVSRVMKNETFPHKELFKNKMQSILHYLTTMIQ